jgi:competence protein ComEC
MIEPSLQRADRLKLAFWPVSVTCAALGVWLAMQPANLLPLGAVAACAAVGLAVWGSGIAWFAARGWAHGARAAVFGLLVICAACAAGFGWAQMAGHQRLAGSLSVEDEGRDLPVVGVVATLPQRIERGVRFGFDVEQCNCSVQGQRISLAWYSDGRADMLQDVPRIVPGQRWQITVRLKRRHGVANPHGFDAELWMLEQGFAGTGYVRPARLSEQPQRLLAQEQGGFFVQIERWRAQTRERMIAQAGDVPQLNVLLALTIGDQRALSQSDWTVYNAAGVGHLLSISGLHVTMFAALMGWLALQLARLWPALVYRIPAPRIGWAVGWAAALAYALVAGFAVPAQRTVLMLTVVVASRLFARQAHPAHVLAWAGFAVLVADPFAILSPGAWFSFAAVAMLMLSDTWAEDVTAADWRQRLKRAAYAQAAVTIGLVPWSILFFSQVSLVSPLANALAIPWISLIVTPVALLGAVAVWPVPALGGWVLDLAALLMRAIDGILRSMAQWDWAVAAFPAPSAAVFAVASAGAVVLLALRSRWRWLGLIAMLPLFAPPLDQPAQGAWRVTFLDVGQGMAVLVETTRRVLLYDAGPQYNADSDSGQRVIAPYLRARGIRQLDGMVISHADSDHSGGAASVQRALPVNWLASTLPAGHPALAGAAPQQDCKAGDAWQWDQLRFTFLHPPAAWLGDAKAKTNALSCVLQVTDGKYTVLLTGDIEAPQEALLLQTHNAALRADVLLVPHHGSKTSSTPAFLEAVAPAYAVFQNGYRNRFSHPAPDVWARYGGGAIERLRSDAHGAVVFDVSARGIAVTRTRLAQPRWWRTPVASP